MKVPKPQRLQLQHHPRCPTVGLLRALRTSEAVYIGAVMSDVLEQPDVVRDQTCLVCGPTGNCGVLTVTGSNLTASDGGKSHPPSSSPSTLSMSFSPKSSRPSGYPLRSLATVTLVAIFCKQAC